MSNETKPTRADVERIAAPWRNSSTYHPATNETLHSAGPSYGWENRHATTSCPYDHRANCDALDALYFVAHELGLELPEDWDDINYDEDQQDAEWTWYEECCELEEDADGNPLWTDGDEPEFLGEWDCVNVWEYVDWSSVIDMICDVLQIDSESAREARGESLDEWK